MTAVGCRFLTFVVIVAFAAACTGSNGSPSPTPTPPGTTSSSTASPEPSPSEPLTTGPNVRPGEKPPEFPALAKRHTAEGAVAFARYFYRALDWGYATNDPFLVTQVSASRCTACRRYVTGLRAVNSRPNAVLMGGHVDLDSASIFQGVLDIDADHAVDVKFDEEPVVLREPGAKPKVLAPGVVNYHSLVFVSWQRKAWAVVEVTDKA